MHLRGWTSEATAQCYAIQLDGWTVEQLGGTADEGHAVAAATFAGSLTRDPGTGQRHRPHHWRERPASAAAAASRLTRAAPRVVT
jgi:hypothetical protein